MTRRYPPTCEDEANHPECAVKILGENFEERKITRDQLGRDVTKRSVL